MTARASTNKRLTAEERTLLGTLVRDVGPRLLAYVRRTFGRGLDAEEIVAEAFCRAAKNSAALLASDRPDLYLLVTVRNLCRDGFRRQQPESQPDTRLDERPGTDPAGPTAVAERERRAALRAAVEELPEYLREVVVLRLSADVRFEEIANMLGIPLGTALSRMHAAIGQLREKLGCVHER